MSETFKIDVYKDIDTKNSYNVKLRKWTRYDWDKIEFRTYGSKDEAIKIAEKLADFINNTKILCGGSPSIHIE